MNQPVNSNSEARAVLVARVFPGGGTHTVQVDPDTVLHLHRQGYVRRVNTSTYMAQVPLADFTLTKTHVKIGGVMLPILGATPEPDPSKPYLSPGDVGILRLPYTSLDGHQVVIQSIRKDHVCEVLTVKDASGTVFSVTRSQFMKT